MKRAKPGKKLSDQELLELILSSTDQDNFEDAMPTYLLEEWIREQGGDPDALWARLAPWIQELLAARTSPPLGDPSTSRPRGPAKETTTRPGDEILEVLDRMDLEDLAAMSSEEVSREIEAAGGDPVAIGQRGAALAERLLERRAQLLEWEDRARAAVQDARRAPGAVSATKAGELRARLDAARGDRRLAERIAATLDHRATQECSDAEVAALVGELDDLERILREFDAERSSPEG
jgi:hypothetical protein